MYTKNSNFVIYRVVLTSVTLRKNTQSFQEEMNALTIRPALDTLIVYV